MTVASRPREARLASARGGVVREIADRRLAELGPALDAMTVAELGRRLAAAPPPRPFAARLAEPGLHLIAEIKRRSPSAGAIAGPREDIVARARAYEAGGAAAISVLCEPHSFGGSVEDMALVRRSIGLPVLAKEFVVHRRQIAVLRSEGADAVLLLAVLHSRKVLASLVAEALDHGLEPLVEAHDEKELEAAHGTRARVIGINNRDLRTLDVDPERASRMRELIPEDRLAIAESGVRDASTIRGWRALGFDAALVGETLVRAGDPTATVRTFVAAGKVPDDPVEAARAPFVKICGIVDEAGVQAAVRAGVDAIGLNLVPGTPRALELAEAVALAAHARRIARRWVESADRADHRRPDGRRSPRDRAGLDADAIQLSGDETPGLHREARSARLEGHPSPAGRGCACPQHEWVCSDWHQFRQPASRRPPRRRRPPRMRSMRRTASSAPAPSASCSTRLVARTPAGPVAGPTHRPLPRSRARSR